MHKMCLEYLEESQAACSENVSLKSVRNFTSKATSLGKRWNCARHTSLQATPLAELHFKNILWNWDVF